MKRSVTHGVLATLVLLGIVLSVHSLQAQAPATIPPVRSWSGEVAASLRTSFTRILLSFIRLVPRFVAGGVTLAIFWAVASGARSVTQRLGRSLVNRTWHQLLEQLVYAGVWVIGIVTALDVLGLDPQAVATGLGLTGIAIGFALKDVVSNFVSGLLIMMMRSFAIGDQIIVGNTEGTVEDIEVRVTRIRTYDGRLVLVPNAEVFSSRVVNNTASPLRRAAIVILLDYQQDLARAMEVITGAMRASPDVASHPAPTVHLCEFTGQNLCLEARYWSDGRRPDFTNTTSEVRTAILQALKAAGVGLPNPDLRTISPGNIDKWQAVLGGRAGASVP